MATLSQPIAYRKLNAGLALANARAGTPIVARRIIEDIHASNITFGEQVSFSNCDFKALDLSSSRFEKGVEFVGCIFRGAVSFEGARINGDCHFRACIFLENSRFDRLQVNGKLEVRAPRDKEALRQNRHRFLLTAPYVIFKKDTSFSQMHVLGEANFGSAQFCESADFYNARIDGPAFFRIDYCKLYRETRDESRGFPDHIFRQRPVRFGERPNGKVLVRKTASNAKTRARFRAAYFGGELNFYGAIFRVDADFSYLDCHGPAFFCNSPPERTDIACWFKSGLDFEGARFKTTLRLDQATYSDHSDNVVSFRDCRVADDLGFGTTLPTILLFAGCNYKRLLGPSHGTLIQAIKDQEERADQARRRQPSNKRLTAFDRSSWIQLEGALRSGGDPESADKVYRARMQQERKLAMPRWRWPANSLWNVISAYGTSPRRLVFWCIAMLIVGAVTFDLSELRENRALQHNALTGGAIDPSPNPTPAATPSAAAKIDKRITIGGEPDRCNDLHSSDWEKIENALIISLIDFSPIKLPLENQCEPAGYVGITVGVGEKVIGFILVPLLIANLSGLLNRRAKANTEEGAQEG